MKRRSGLCSSARAACAGFSLLEIMIAVVIAGLLATLAQAGWWSQVLRVRRIDATASLLQAAAAQESFLVREGRYAEQLVPDPPDGLGFPGTRHGWYRLEIERADDHGFLIVAIPAVGSVQNNDEPCQQFSVDHLGRRASSPAPPEVCWR
ncbi:MAG: type IV pilin protein [Gammaproteobacteria bacterium]